MSKLDELRSQHIDQLEQMHAMISQMPGQTTRRKRVESLIRRYGGTIPQQESTQPSTKRQRWAQERRTTH